MGFERYATQGEEKACFPSWLRMHPMTTGRTAESAGRSRAGSLLDWLNITKKKRRGPFMRK